MCTFDAEATEDAISANVFIFGGAIEYRALAANA
jgi:hypothetical protein